MRNPIESGKETSPRKLALTVAVILSAEAAQAEPVIAPASETQALSPASEVPLEDQPNWQ